MASQNLFNRFGTGVAVLASAALLVTACTSSTSKPQNTNTTSSGAGSTTPAATSTAPASIGSTGAGGGTGIANSPFLSGVCKEYAADAAKAYAAFGNPSASAGLAPDVAAFDTFTKDAPSDIKSSFQVIDQALHEILNKDYSALQANASQISAAGTQISAWVAANCK